VLVLVPEDIASDHGIRTTRAGVVGTVITPSRRRVGFSLDGDIVDTMLWGMALGMAAGRRSLGGGYEGSRVSPVQRPVTIHLGRGGEEDAGQWPLSQSSRSLTHRGQSRQVH
jgi:hypothetical protein